MGPPWDRRPLSLHGLLINCARLFMKTWFDPTTAISFDPTKARGSESALCRASKEGVVMPLQLHVGVVMPPHLIRIGPKK